MLRPYLQLMRLDAPIGYRLLFFPASWAVAFVAPAHRIAPLLVLMWFGAVIIRAAGCIINDLTDRKLDAEVARTRARPLASGTIALWHAYVLLMLLLLAGLLIALQLPPAVFTLALVALPMIAAYPWMKRITWWPQVFLGLTFNLSALFGWLGAAVPLAPAAFTLYAAAIFWTLGYDTIYAVQDMADDARVGIKSTARRVGRQLVPFVAGCYLSMLALLSVTGQIMGAGQGFALALFITAAHLLWQLRHLARTPADAARLFRSNQWPGLALLIGIWADRLLGLG